MQRRRFKNILSFPDRLDQEIERLRAEAEKLPLGSHEREMLLRKARQAETAMHINDWLSSPGLQPPKAVQDLFIASSPRQTREKPGARAGISTGLLAKARAVLGTEFVTPILEGNSLSFRLTVSRTLTPSVRHRRRSASGR